MKNKSSKKFRIRRDKTEDYVFCVIIKISQISIRFAV